jgi:hypothetical protein
MYPSSLLGSLLCVTILPAADYGLTQVQNMCNQEFYISVEQLQKRNVLSKTYNKILLSQLTSGKLSLKHIFLLSKFYQTTS